jgi:hypothetical protein
MPTIGVIKQLSSDLETITGNFIVIDALSLDAKADLMQIRFNIYQSQAAFQSGGQPLHSFARQFQISQTPAQLRTAMSTFRDQCYSAAVANLPFLSGATVVNV